MPHQIQTWRRGTVNLLIIQKFPPLIYYKIFAHGPVVDINAFAPRDYMKIKREKKKTTVDIKFDKDADPKFNGWYERFENNGWRPVIP